MAFEKFPRQFGRKSRGVFVSINKRSNFTFSDDFYTKHLKNKKAIELFFDKSKKIIGLKPLLRPTNDSYDIRVAAADKNRCPIRTLSAQAFMKYFDIAITDTKRFKPVWNEKEELWEIKLDEPI